MIRIALAAAIAAATWAAVAFYLSRPAEAQGVPCAPTDAIREVLGRDHGEQPLVRALTADGMLLELWGDPADGSWTALVTRPDGLSCAVSAGTGFERLPMIEGSAL